MLSNQVNNQSFLFISPSANNDKVTAKDAETNPENKFQEIVEQNTSTESTEDCNKPDRVSAFKAASAVLNKVKDLTDNNEDSDSKELDDIKKYADIYMYVLSTLQNRLEDKAENLTKEIAYLDINKAGAVDAILANADAIEKLKGLEASAQKLLQNLDPEFGNADLSQSSTTTIKLDADLEEDLNIQIESFISQAESSPEEQPLEVTATEQSTLTATESKNESFELKTNKAGNEKLSNLKDSKLQVDNKEPILNQQNNTDSKGDEGKSKKDDKKGLEAEVKLVDLLAEHNPSDHSLSFSSLNTSTISSPEPTKLTTKIETVNINELSNYLQNNISEAPRNSHQEIKLELSPDSHGKVDLTIIKNENNEISVKLVFHNKDSLELVKQDLKDNILELREVLKNKNLDLSKFEVGESNSSNTAYGGEPKSSSFNEARDEQRKRLYDTLPEWVKDGESIKQGSFGRILEGI